MKKKFLALGLTLVLALSLASCGEKKDDKTDATATPEVTTEAAAATDAPVE